MPCLPPATVSPGTLYLVYRATGPLSRLTIGWNLIYGTDLTDIPNLRIEANRLANYIYRCVPPIATFVNWGIRVHGGGVYYEEPLTASLTGTHAVASSMQEYYSTTVAFVGHGLAPLPGGCAGRIISRLHTFGALPFPPGSKSYNAASDAVYQSFITNGLNASTYLAADYYGQQGEVGLIMPVQWNAAIQRRYGS